MKKLNIKIFPEIENLKNQGKDDACLWEYIEKRNPEQKFSVPLIKKFVENDVCPDELAHLDLDDKSLMALYQKNPQVCAEAAMTLTERKLRPAVSVRQFSNVFSKCCDDRICAWLFRRMIYNPVYDEATTEKYRRAIDIIQKKYKPSDDVYKESLRLREFLDLLITDNTAYIRACSRREDDVLLMAVSLNENTPADVVERLMAIKDIKNAKIIRTNAARLKKRVGNPIRGARNGRKDEYRN